MFSSFPLMWSFTNGSLWDWCRLLWMSAATLFLCIFQLFFSAEKLLDLTEFFLSMPLLRESTKWFKRIIPMIDGVRSLDGQTWGRRFVFLYNLSSSMMDDDDVNFKWKLANLREWDLYFMNPLLWHRNCPLQCIVTRNPTFFNSRQHFLMGGNIYD